MRTIVKKQRHGLYMAAAAALVLGAVPTYGAAQAAPSQAAASRVDLSGYWRITRPVTQVRTVEGQAPPLKAEGQTKYRQNVAMAQRRDRSFDGVTQCLMPGIPRLQFMAQPFQILQRDHTVYFTYEHNRIPRRVFMNKPLPTEPNEFYLGEFVGRWEGDTLVVETVNFNDLTILDNSGLPHGTKLKVTERLRLTNGGRTLENRITVEDPDFYERPWTTVVTYNKLPDTHVMREHVCMDDIDPMFRPKTYQPIR